jgi:ferredoxin
MVLEDPYAAAREADQVGFVFPVHRATMPEMVRGFIEHMPIRPDCYYFAVSTYTVFGCNEFWDIDELLRAKGAVLNYAAGIKMVGSVGLVDKDSLTVQRILRSVDEQIAEIAEQIEHRQESHFRRSIKLLGKMVRLYTDNRRKSIVFTVNERCKRCGICAQVCPAQNITVDENGTVAPIRSDKCTACLACIHWCPANALSTTTKIHSHYHHPEIKPEQLNPSLLTPKPLDTDDIAP